MYEITSVFATQKFLQFLKDNIFLNITPGELKFHHHFKANGYSFPGRFIDGCKSHKSRERQGDQAVMRNPVVLPYAKGASEKITRVLSQHNINVAQKPVRTVDCAAVYIGQTSHAL